MPFLSFAILTSMLTCPAIQVIYVDRAVGMSSPVRHCLTAEANLLQGCQSFRKREWERGNAERVDGSWMKFSLICWETVESFEWSCTGILQFTCWWDIQAILFQFTFKNFLFTYLINHHFVYLDLTACFPDIKIPDSAQFFHIAKWILISRVLVSPVIITCRHQCP